MHDVVALIASDITQCRDSIHAQRAINTLDQNRILPLQELTAQPAHSNEMYDLSRQAVFAKWL